VHQKEVERWGRKREIRRGVSSVGKGIADKHFLLGGVEEATLQENIIGGEG